MTEQTRKSTEWVELSKVSWGEVFPGNHPHVNIRLPPRMRNLILTLEHHGDGVPGSYAAIGGAERPPTDRNTKSFSVEGWGPGNPPPHTTDSNVGN